MRQVVTQVVLRWTTEFNPARRAHILVGPDLPKPQATQRVVGRTFEVWTPIHEPVMLAGYLILKVFIRVDWLRSHNEDGPHSSHGCGPRTSGIPKG